MGSRASTYALSGGMNRRKAGEDFYFLHKIGPLGKIVAVRNTAVYPSARLSDRVPFGTGKAQQEWLVQSNRHRFLYHPQIFEDLRSFLNAIPAWYNSAWTLGAGTEPAYVGCLYSNFCKIKILPSLE